MLFFTINILSFFLLSNPVNDRADYIRPNPVNDRADYIRFKDQTKDLFRSINTITVLLQLEFHSLKVHLNCACSFHSVNYSLTVSCNVHSVNNSSTFSWSFHSVDYNSPCYAVSE